MTARISALGLCLALAAVSPAFARATLVVFDAPGAGIGVRQGTFVGGIDKNGDVVGNYVSQDFSSVAYIRTPDGGFTPIETPDSVFAYAISGRRQTTGHLDDVDGEHGFIAGIDGTVEKIFDVEGLKDAVGAAINAKGAVTGQAIDASGVFHGFVRQKGGATAVFDAPGAGTGLAQGTQALAIGADGFICGVVIDASDVAHGVFRRPDGALSAFDAPGAVSTTPAGVDRSDAIAGTYSDAGGAMHGFIRSADGAFTTFDAPHAGTAAGQGTIVGGINASGAVTGTVIGRNRALRGYLRSAQGRIVVFRVRGTGNAPGTGTSGLTIGDRNEIAGVVVDSAFATHGFLRTP